MPFNVHIPPTPPSLGSLPLGEPPRLPRSSVPWVMALRAVPNNTMRRIVAGLAAGCVRALRPDRGENEQPSLKEAVETLEARGLAMIPPAFSPAELAQVQTYLRDQLLVDGEQRFVASEPPPNVGHASYPLAVVLRCPHVLELANRPELLQAARSYLGCIPTISGLRIDWAAPSARGPVHVQQFHRDYDDWRFMKLMVYLFDVDEGAGPHEYVLGSHRGSGRFRAVAYPKGEVESRYGEDVRVRIKGPAGTSFLADTWGIHRGVVPTARPRLLLQIQYSILPVYKFAYQPFPVTASIPYDRYVNRLLLAPAP